MKAKKILKLNKYSIAKFTPSIKGGTGSTISNDRERCGNTITTNAITRFGCDNTLMEPTGGGNSADCDNTVVTCMNCPPHTA